LLADRTERIQGAVLAGLTYLTSLVVIVNLLNPIWPPLVTATYALFGAVLLVVSKRRGGDRLLRQLGGVTMVIVVARLFFVDLDSVETIWRVLLFLVVGGLFLYAGYRLNTEKVVSS
jgi:peptidoglycan/LPS O-acetylase OafA/YrhL